MEIRFWGVRGSIPVSGADFNVTGGSTTCVELTQGEHRLILDAGTGLRALGAHLGWAPLKATILFSHLHWDHIQGLPFFQPAYHPESELTLMNAGSPEHLKEILSLQMKPPTFPVGLEKLQGLHDFCQILIGERLELGPFSLRALPQSHPDGGIAYRIECGGQSLVFATDTEHEGDDAQELMALAEGCDLLIHDAQYSPDEYQGLRGPSRRGWGHSSWRAAAQVAREAGVQRLALFHHDPNRTDEEVEHFERCARSVFPETFAAREGWAVAL